MGNKVQVSLRCCARSGSRTLILLHHAAGRSRRWLGAAGFCQQNYSLCSLGPWLRISSKQLLWVLKLVQSFQTHILPHIHLPVTGGSEQWTIAFIGPRIILHVLLKCRATGFLIPRRAFPMHCHNLIYVALCVCVFLDRGDSYLLKISAKHRLPVIMLQQTLGLKGSAQFSLIILEITGCGCTWSWGISFIVWKGCSSS